MNIKTRIPDWLIGFPLTLFFLFITWTGFFDFTDGIESKLFDVRAWIAAPDTRNPDIELVAISDDDLSELGRFPWPRHILAQGIQNLSKAGAKVIALDILFPEPEDSAGLKAIGRLKELYEASGLDREEAGQHFYRELSTALVDLDNDTKLADAIRKAGNVALPVFFDSGSKGRDDEAPDFVSRHAYRRIQDAGDISAASSPIHIPKLKPLLPSFADAAAGIGHVNLFVDPDGHIRHQAHLIHYQEGTYFPSFAMAIARLYMGLQLEEIGVVLGEGFHLRGGPASGAVVPVADQQMQTLISWNQGPDIVFNHTPFARVYRNQFQASLFKDKIVLIGATALGIGDHWVTPVSRTLPGVEVVANAVANILNQRFLSRPLWIPLVELGALLFFGFFLTFVLPRLRAGMGAVTTLALLAGYGAAGTILFFSASIWLKITPPILLLILGYALVISKRFLITEKTKERVEADSVETNKMLGLSFQQQGMLDLALEKFRHVPLEEEGAKELLYNLGLDYERKRQFSKALATYKLIVGDGRNFKDLDERIPKLKTAEATMIFGTSGGPHPGDMGATLADTETKPTLGRYEVIGELGRGAMGVVYKGQDPKIRRTVAIKTLNLSNFQEDDVAPIKERFFREAESAGLLTHRNIVTIYDCGEEHDLAYIAMEYLEGEDLDRYTKPEQLLPLREALNVVEQVADALDYAHDRDIVHRDIKPANIMRMKGTNEVKVTDFGIARIASSSQTKTGVVLGTPSYMSPEQVAGKKVDGRSDIFSLGVVMFVLLTGRKPFVGEDITSLMFKIAKESHPSAKDLNPKVPRVVEKIIDKALEKDLEKRYQKAGQMAVHLRQVIDSIDEIIARKNPQPNL